MDLEQAAHTAVTMMRQLLAAVATARSRCEEALANVSTLAAQVDADRTELHRALTAMEKQMADLAASLSTALTDSEPKVASIAQHAAPIGQPDAGAAGPTASQELDAEAAAFHRTREGLEAIGSELEAVVSAAESAGQAALARADDLGEALRTVMDEAEQRVSISYASFLSGLRESSVERAGQVSDLLERACVALLVDRERSWEEKRRACHGLLERVFHDVETHTDALVTEALDSCAARVAEALADLTGTVGLVEAGWLDLEVSCVTAATCVDTTPPLPDRLMEVAQASHVAAEAVVAVRQAWRNRGFGR